MAAMRDSWRQLRISGDNAQDAPKLFYSFTSKSDEYRVRITDLVHMWEQRASQDEILRDAASSHCSIDPSESAPQRNALLEKLGHSLSHGQNVLVHGQADRGHGFDVATSSMLPAPLSPLHWTFRLRRLSQVAFSELLVHPCLHELGLLQDQVTSLQQIIKEKDHVMAKLLDKIEGSAIDIGLLFPGISGSKSRRHVLTVAEATDHVPGMKAFDRAIWLSELQPGISLLILACVFLQLLLRITAPV